MFKFVCKTCTFRFKSESNQLGKMCPYCGEKKLMKEESAEEMVTNQKENQYNGNKK